MTLNFTAASKFGPATRINLIGISSESFAPLTESAVVRGLIPCPPKDYNCQIVRVNPRQQSVSPGSVFTVDLDYEASSPTTTGVGIAVFWDSSKVQFDDLPFVFNFGLDGVQPPLDDTTDADNDSTTDRKVLLGWSEVAPIDWPGSVSQRLATVRFVAAAGFTTGATQINVRDISVAAGYLFFSVPGTVFAEP